MSGYERATLVLRANSVFLIVVGLVLLADSWDGFYDAFDLPQALPALAAQLGGVFALAFAYVLWVAPRSSVLRKIAGAAAVADGLAALILAVWLIFRDKEDLGIGDLGTALLILAIVILAGLAAAVVLALGRASEPVEAG
jgi:hypothetical protein